MTKKQKSNHGLVIFLSLILAGLAACSSKESQDKRDFMEACAAQTTAHYCKCMLKKLTKKRSMQEVAELTANPTPDYANELTSDILECKAD